MNRVQTIVCVAAAVALAAYCTNLNTPTDGTAVEASESVDDGAREGAASPMMASSQSPDSARNELAGTTYEGQGAAYGCTEDCSGHDAGYEWAKDNEVTDPSDCGGNSASFNEGCEAYAEAYQDELSASDEANEE